MKNRHFIPRRAVEAAWMPSYAALNYNARGGSAVLGRSQEIIERQFSSADTFGRVLEIGAGTGEHLASVRHRYDHYIASDRSEFFLSMLKSRFDGVAKVSVQNVDAYTLPFPDAHFDRIIATHVLEHLENPVDVLTEWDRCVRPGGVISLILPCDPGLLYRVGRALGPRRRAEKIGMPYDYVMAREHVNSIYNLRALIRFHYPDAQEQWWPFPWLKSPDLNAIYGVHMRK